jgi:hypothetical protein
VCSGDKIKLNSDQIIKKRTAVFHCRKKKLSLDDYYHCTDCNNYRGISLLPTTYNILSNILLSRLIPFAEEVIGDHQCGFRRNRSTTDHILCIHQILEKKWEYNEVEHQLFIDFKKAYDSFMWEVLYNILTEFGIPKKLVWLLKMCLTERYSRVRVDKNLSDIFLIRNVLEQGNPTLPLLFHFAAVCH